MHDSDEKRDERKGVEGQEVTLIRFLKSEKD